jgi:hypothetical protein
VHRAASVLPRVHHRCLLPHVTAGSRARPLLPLVPATMALTTASSAPGAARRRRGVPAGARPMVAAPLAPRARGHAGNGSDGMRTYFWVTSLSNAFWILVLSQLGVSVIIRTYFAFCLSRLSCSLLECVSVMHSDYQTLFCILPLKAEPNAQHAFWVYKSWFVCHV